MLKYLAFKHHLVWTFPIGKIPGGEEGRGILGFEENLKNEEESEEGYNEEQKDV